MRLSRPGIRELFFVLQRVLHTTEQGAFLPLKEFSSMEIGRKLCDGLTRTGLIRCMDPDSWKPRAWNFDNARGRRFVPSTELLLANAGQHVVENVAEYLGGHCKNRMTRRTSEVILCPESLVPISAVVVARLQDGTGLRFNLNRAITLLAGKADELAQAASSGRTRCGRISR